VVEFALQLGEHDGVAVGDVGRGRHAQHQVELAVRALVQHLALKNTQWMRVLRLVLAPNRKLNALDIPDSQALRSVTHHSQALYLVCSFCFLCYR
jgi:hypothetical protein